MRTTLYQYEPEQLKALQLVELDMLKVIDRICRKYEIPYFLVWGSMLGAVRHKGFIPWDDDIDVGLLREDYERLRKVPAEEWGDKYVLVDPKDNNPLHRLAYPQVHKIGSVFETEYHWKHDKMKGNVSGERMPIWLDVFLYDHIASPKSGRKRWNFVFLLGKLYYYAKCRITPSRDDSLKNKMINCGKMAIYYMLNVFHKPELKICNLIERICQKDNGDYIAIFFTTSKNHMSPCKKDELFPLKEVEFEDMKTFIPKDYDRRMRDRYGNHYMEMPSMDKRINHPPYILNLGDGGSDVINQST
jgi:lipopolysaccharide cholinephosphotransferase